jgi:two-component system, OmpR family, KDP operon response regulator KdpE
VAHLLVVEDDAEIRRAMIRALSQVGHTVSSTATGTSALQAVLDDRPDLVILDLGLPDIDGCDVLRMIRAVSPVPVIVATARDDEGQVIQALDRGADDYLVKPFGVGQLDARIRAVLRRGGGPPAGSGPIEVGGLRVDPGAREVTVDGVAVELTPREFDLLRYLAARAGTVVTKRELITQVWHQPYGGADKTLDVHLSWLRRKLGESATRPRYLHTVRGVGVKVAAPTDAGTDPDLDGASDLDGESIGDRRP